MKMTYSELVDCASISTYWDKIAAYMGRQQPITASGAMVLLSSILGGYGILARKPNDIDLQAEFMNVVTFIVSYHPKRAERFPALHALRLTDADYMSQLVNAGPDGGDPKPTPRILELVEELLRDKGTGEGSTRKQKRRTKKGG